MKRFDPRKLTAPPPGLYTCIWPPFSKIFFFSQITRPIKANFYFEPAWEGGGEKVYINGTGHMTKMAATPIYGKNLQKSSSTELSFDHETWHGALYTQAFRKLYE